MMNLSKDHKRMIALVWPHRHVLALAVLAMIVNAALGGLPIVGLVIPFVDVILAGKPIAIPNEDSIPRFAVDFIYRLNAMPRAQLLNLLIFWTIGLSFFRLLFEYLQSLWMNDLSQRVIRDLRNDVYGKIVSLPLSFFGRSQTGALVSRITYDTGVVRDAISEGLTDFFFQPV